MADDPKIRAKQSRSAHAWKKVVQDGSLPENVTVLRTDKTEADRLRLFASKALKEPVDKKRVEVLEKAIPTDIKMLQGMFREMEAHPEKYEAEVKYVAARLYLSLEKERKE